ncbi:MAG: ABC transporter permease [Candidatus Hydrogenedentes bacterium]|nr:ABC transporter permease [Candidatus Hydrogenedentota bacterium]
MKAAGEYLGLAAVLAVLVAFFSLNTGHFFSFASFQTMANQIPDTLIVAVGMTGVLLIGGIDLSVGSVMALGGAVLGVSALALHMPLPIAVLLCLAAGLVCGGANALVAVRWSIPSFIVTLGMLEIARGGAYLITDSRTQYLGQGLSAIAEPGLFGLSLAFLVSIVVVAIGQVIVSFTTFGRYMLAVGTSEESARLSGINTTRVRAGVFITSGLLSAVAGVVQCARLSASDPNAGIGLELQAIAAVVIGGTTLLGGRGSVIGSFFGVLVIAVMENGLAQMGAQEPTKRVITGCVIVLAVIVDYYRHRFGKKQ